MCSCRLPVAAIGVSTIPSKILERNIAYPIQGFKAYYDFLPATISRA
jgi:hypothetical protein